MSSGGVVPRVIPIFIKELCAATTRNIRDEHIHQLIANLTDVFNSRVLDDDVIDLVACLLSLMKLECDEIEALTKAAAANNRSSVSAEESNVLLTIVPETTSFQILRLLILMFDLKSLHASRCFRAMKKFSENLTRQKAIAAQRAANNEIMAAAAASASGSPVVGGGGGGGADDSLAALSPVRRVTQSVAAGNNNKSISNSSYAAGGGVSISISAAAAADRRPSSINDRIAFSVDDVMADPLLISMDGLLQNDSTRRMVIRLWKEWDGSGVEIDHFTQFPEKLHLYLPQRASNKMRVYRDFCFCTARPKLTKQWGSTAACHIKTNIPKKSDIMYRILVEGYNYGVNAVVFSDVVGYTNRNWETITDLEQYGWPKGWDSEMANDYAPGAVISQYYSTDGFLVVKLRAKSMFCMGFSVSGWLVFHGFGAGFPISGAVHHQDEDL